jgi:hypothetical protein
MLHRVAVEGIRHLLLELSRHHVVGLVICVHVPLRMALPHARRCSYIIRIILWLHYLLLLKLLLAAIVLLVTRGGCRDIDHDRGLTLLRDLCRLHRLFGLGGRFRLLDFHLRLRREVGVAAVWILNRSNGLIGCWLVRNFRLLGLPLPLLGLIGKSILAVGR